jgi:hypothetical protein
MKRNKKKEKRKRKKGIGNMEAKGTNKALLDLFANLFIIMLVIVVLILDQKKESTEIDLSPGNLIYYIAWDDQRTDDVDLWVEPPDETVIGFLRKNGETFDLLRDDVGITNDFNKANFEYAISRGLKRGVYRAALHFYCDRGGPILVHFRISLLKNNKEILLVQDSLILQTTNSRASLPSLHSDGNEIFFVNKVVSSTDIIGAKSNC